MSVYMDRTIYMDRNFYTIEHSLLFYGSEHYLIYNNELYVYFFPGFVRKTSSLLSRIKKCICINASKKGKGTKTKAGRTFKLQSEYEPVEYFCVQWQTA